MSDSIEEWCYLHPHFATKVDELGADIELRDEDEQ